VNFHLKIIFIDVLLLHYAADCACRSKALISGMQEPQLVLALRH